MTSETPAGPDLQEGVSESELAEGAMLAGRVGEDAVMLARRNGEVFALDAHCTHYSGPLAEGAMVGDTIRCPWHHACFDLRTGSPLGAPAMRPLKTWKVERSGDRIRVLAESQTVTASSTESNQHIVILGAGAAGSFAASELRRIGFGGKVTLITREERLPYDRPNLSKDYLAGRAPLEWIPLKSEEDYASERIDLRLKSEVESIDTARSELRVKGGETIAFDRLIVATGATPRRLDIPGADGPRVHYLRTWSDADALIAAAGGARSAVVIGASFIGLETAGSLRERGLAVTVVGVEERPLERVLGREAGDFVRNLHEEHGVRFRLGRKPVEIRADAVVLDDGSVEACDLVVIGVGVIPELALAERAGLRVDKGLVVDDHLRTSAANIFAAGDIARFPYGGRAIRVEHWAAAGRQGQCAARNAAGHDEPLSSIPFFWSQHYDLVFAYVGHAESAEDAQLFGSLGDHNAAIIYRDQGRITAITTLFRDDISLAVEAAMERGAGDEEILDIVKRGF